MSENQPKAISKTNRISQNVEAINENLNQQMYELADTASDITVEALNPVNFFETYKGMVSKKLVDVTKNFIESDYEIPDFGCSALAGFSASLREQYHLPSKTEMKVVESSTTTQKQLNQSKTSDNK